MRGLFLTAAFFVLASAAVGDDDVRRFIWEQGNAQAASAWSPAEFREAEKNYLRLVNDGMTSPEVYLNLGAAAILARDAITARRAFLAAERITGTTPEIETGLAAARRLAQEPVQDWKRIVFKWHYALPHQTRLDFAVYGWCLFWGLLCVYRLHRNFWTGSLVWLSVFAGFLFSVSAGVTFSESHRGGEWMLPEPVPQQEESK